MAPVAQDRDAVADPIHLVEPVRDVDNRHAAGDQPTDQREELVDFARRERGGRLVHHQHRCRRGQGLRDLHHLALREAQEVQRHTRRNLHAQFGEKPRCPIVELTPIDEAAPGGRRVAEKDVLGHGEVRHQVQLLIDDANPAGQRVGRTAEVDGDPVHHDVAAVLTIGATQDLHERGLAGAVLAEQHVHLAGPQRQIHAVERDDAGKALADCAHLEGVRWHGHGTGSSKA